MCVCVCVCINIYMYSLIAQLVKNLPAMQRTWFNSWVRKIRWGRDRLPTPIFLGFPYGSASKESASNAGDLGSIPGLGRCPEEGKGYPHQYFGLEDSMDCIVHRIAKSRTWLSNFHTHTHTHTHTGVCVCVYIYIAHLQETITVHII